VTHASLKNPKNVVGIACASRAYSGRRTLLELTLGADL